MKRGGGGGGGGGAGAGMCPAAAPLHSGPRPAADATRYCREGRGGRDWGRGAPPPPPRCPPAAVGSGRRLPEGKRGRGSPPPPWPRGSACLQWWPLPSCRSPVPRRLRVCLGRVGVVGLRGFGVGWWWFGFCFFGFLFVCLDFCKFFFTLRHRNLQAEKQIK